MKNFSKNCIFKLLKAERNLELKERWHFLITWLKDKFSDGEALDVKGILNLIGLL